MSGAFPGEDLDRPGGELSQTDRDHEAEAGGLLLEKVGGAEEITARTILVSPYPSAAAGTNRRAYRSQASRTGIGGQVPHRA